MADGTNFNSVLIAAIVTIPPTIVGLGAWRSSRATKREVQSPNGTKTGEAIHDLQVNVMAIRLKQGEFEGAVALNTVKLAEIQASQEQHREDDNRRFDRIFDQLGLEDAP